MNRICKPTPVHPAVEANCAMPKKTCIFVYSIEIMPSGEFVVHVHGEYQL